MTDRKKNYLPLNYGTVLTPLVGGFNKSTDGLNIPILGGRRRTDTSVAAVKARGGPRSKKVSSLDIKEIMEDHGFSAEYTDSGGVKVLVPKKVNRQGNMTYEVKTFRGGATLGTIRDWLGY